MCDNVRCERRELVNALELVVVTDEKKKENQLAERKLTLASDEVDGLRTDRHIVSLKSDAV